MSSYIIEIYEGGQSDILVFADGRESCSIVGTPSDRETDSYLLSETILLVSPVFVTIFGREDLYLEIFDGEVLRE